MTFKLCNLDFELSKLTNYMPGSRKLHYKKKFSTSEEGFTLVEMTVVMSIIAIIFLFGASSMLSVGGQVRLRDAAKTLQSNIRKMANNSISVSPDTTDPTIPAKLWGISVPCGEGNTSYDIFDYHSPEDTSGVITLTKSSPKTIDLEGGVTISAGGCSGNVVLLFSAPFARFNAVTNNDPSWLVDASTKEIYPDPSDLTNGIISEEIKIILKDPKENQMTLTINYKTGETSVGN